MPNAIAALRQSISSSSMASWYIATSVMSRALPSSSGGFEPPSPPPKRKCWAALSHLSYDDDFHAWVAPTSGIHPMRYWRPVTQPFHKPPCPALPRLYGFKAFAFVRVLRSSWLAEPLHTSLSMLHSGFTTSGRCGTRTHAWFPRATR